MDRIETLATVRKNRRDNQEWIRQRHWQHSVHKIQEEDKQNKKPTQKTKKMSNMDPTKNQVLAKDKQFLPLIRYPLCYSNSLDVLNTTIRKQEQMTQIRHEPFDTKYKTRSNIILFLIIRCILSSIIFQPIWPFSKVCFVSCLMHYI